VVAVVSGEWRLQLPNISGWYACTYPKKKFNPAAILDAKSQLLQ
jgi:hypothetical protein